MSLAGKSTTRLKFEAILVKYGLDPLAHEFSNLGTKELERKVQEIYRLKKELHETKDISETKNTSDEVKANDEVKSDNLEKYNKE
jgi:hypothetical protein